MGRLTGRGARNHPVDGNASSTGGFTLLELIVVIGIIAFLSNVVIRQFSEGLEQKNLDATIDNVGVYFSNASRLARASGQWTLIVLNVDPDSQGYLRQMGTYQWFEGEEPGEADNYMDINGNGRHDQYSSRGGARQLVKGWTVGDAKGFWLPNKIFFDLRRSGPAQYLDSNNTFRTFDPHTSDKKYLYFAMEHQNTANSKDDPDDIIKRGRLPFFLDRSLASNTAQGENQILNTSNAVATEGIGVNPELAAELRFSLSKNAKNWIMFAFDRQGRYVNIKSGEVLGTGAPKEAQQDFIVLSQGYIDYSGDPPQIRGPNKGPNKSEPEHAAFLLHRNGSYTKSHDDGQIPSRN